MTPIKIAVVIISLLFSTSCLAQASLVLKNFDNKTVGWLLAKNPASPEYQYLTPDGLILTLDWRHWVTSTYPGTPDKLLYELSDCADQPLVDQSLLRIGEIFQLAGDRASDIFVAHSFTQTGSFVITVASEMDKTGACTNMGAPYSAAVRKVSVVDPVDYGLTQHSNPAIHAWMVLGAELTVERPEAVFCNSFESCPTK